MLKLNHTKLLSHTPILFPTGQNFANVQIQ